MLLLLLLIFGCLVLRILLTERALALLSRAIPGLEQSEHGSEYVGQVDSAALVNHYLGLFLDSSYFSSLVEVTATLIRPSEVVSRVSHNLSLLDKSYQVSLSRLIQGQEELTLFPALRVPKGTPLGNLRVHVDETRARTLPFDLSKGLMLATIYLVFERVFPTGGKEDLLARSCALAVGQRFAEDEASARTEFLALLDQELEQSSAAESDKDALKLVMLMSIYCDTIFVVCDSGYAGVHRITIDYRARYVGGVFGVRNLFRSIFGIGQKDFTFELPYLTESRSFHFDVTGPEGMYVAERFLWTSGTGSPLIFGHSKGRPRDQLMRITPRVGDNVSHLYMRDFDGAPMIAESTGPSPSKSSLVPEFRIEFREIPPGLLGPVFSVTVWLFALTWLVGIFHNIVFPAQISTELREQVEDVILSVLGAGRSNEELAGNIADVIAGLRPSAGQTWPTLIFGVPAIVTGWILSRATSQVIRTVSFSTFIALVWLATNAALLVILSALKSSGVEAVNISVGPIHVNHLLWSVMMFSTAFHFAVCAVMFVSRGSYYRSIASER